MLDKITDWIKKVFRQNTAPLLAETTTSVAGSAPAVGIGPDDVPLGGVGAGLVAIYLLLVAAASFAFLLWSWPTLEVGCRNDEAAITKTPATTTASGEEATLIKLDKISPDSGSITGGTLVQLRGKSLPANPTVLFDNIPAKIKAKGPTVIIAQTPSHSLGPVNVEVNNGGAQSATLTAAYAYICPDGYESKLFVAALLAGILGASLHAMRSLIWYRGNKTLVRSWTLRYLLLPFTGGIIGVAFYLLVHVGLFTPQSGKGSLLIVAIAVLVGMFSEQATEKLKKIAEALLTEAPKGANQTPPTQPANAGAGTEPPKNYSMEPEIGSADGMDLVVLSGPGLSAGTTVTLGGLAVTGRLVGSTFVFNAPAHSAGRVDLVVTNPSQPLVTLSNAYLYTPISPASGPKAGNTKITIKWNGFPQNPSVTLGGVPVKGLTVVNANTLTAVTPPAAKEGIAALEVTDGGGGMPIKLPEAFKYTS